MNEPIPELPEDIEHISYRDLLQKYKDELRYFHFERKTEMVRRLAQKLRDEGTPEDMISATLISDLRGYDIHPDTIRASLGEEVKQKSKKREKFARKIRANDNKIPIELSTTGQPIIESESPTPVPPTFGGTKLPDKTNDIDLQAKYEESLLKIGKLEEQLKEQTEHYQGVLKAINDNKNKEITESKEYKALESEIYLLKEENSELKHLEAMHIKEHPEGTFQSAASLPPTKELEIEFPAKDLSTMFLDARNAKNTMYLQIKDNIVVGWQSDYIRNKAQVHH